jgi:hypothetical protein
MKSPFQRGRKALYGIASEFWKLQEVQFLNIAEQKRLIKLSVAESAVYSGTASRQQSEFVPL